MFCGIKAGVDYLLKEDGAQKRKDNYSTVPSCAYKKCKQQLFKLSNAQKIPFWFAPSSSSPPPPPPLPERSGVQGPHLYTPANRELVFKINSVHVFPHNHLHNCSKNTIFVSLSRISIYCKNLSCKVFLKFACFLGDFPPTCQNVLCPS